MRAARSDAPHESAKRPDRSDVATLLNHLEEARRAEPWVILERGAHELAVRIEDRTRGAEGAVDETVGLDGEGDGVVVDAELGGDGSHLPVLGEEEPADARAKLRRDHRATSLTRRRRRSSN